MKKLIKPSTIKGHIQAPASKSYAQRAIAAALLSNGRSILKNYSTCNDSEAAISIIKKLGAEVAANKGNLEIIGKTDFKTSTLNCGESGLGVRMFTPIAALHNELITITGSGSLQKRPMEMLKQPLEELGATCQTNNGFLPIAVKGPLIGGEISIDGSLSSQILTGLLMATPLAQRNSQIKVTNLKSKPYIDMTLKVLQDFGIKVSNKNYEIFTIQGNQEYRPTTYNIEGDWSGAAFLLVAGAINGAVCISNLNSSSKQADQKIMEVLRLAGANITFEAKNICIEKSTLIPFTFDATDCPDLFPPLVVLAANCSGTSKIKGTSRLKHKESDRAIVLKEQFARIGIKIEVKGDTMLIEGGKIYGGSIHSNNDHRIAMAAAVAAINSQQGIEIENAASITKSYPEFYIHLKQLGARVI